MTEDATRIQSWLQRRCHRAPGRSTAIAMIWPLFHAHLGPEERPDWTRTKFVNAVAEFAVLGTDKTGRLAVANVSLDPPPILHRDPDTGRLQAVVRR